MPSSIWLTRPSDPQIPSDPFRSLPIPTFIGTKQPQFSRLVDEGALMTVPHLTGGATVRLVILGGKKQGMPCNVVKTMINHPPVITIFYRWYVHHFQMGGLLVFYPHY
jgi:hypothetical protein